MKYGIFFFVCMAFLVATGLMTGSAVAENGCPNGYEPWKIPVESSSDCMAIPDYGNDTVEKSQVPIWETNWGAVAIGDGGWGVAVNMRSKAKAKRRRSVNAERPQVIKALNVLCSLIIINV